MSQHIRFDWAIKRLLRQKSNFVILEGFLSELLKDDIIITEILESESNKEEVDSKFNKVDILVKNSKDELMLIEVQNERERDYFHRMNYGQAKLLIEHINEGEEYEKIKKIFSINIVYFNLGQGSDYVYKGKTEFRGLHKNDVLQLNNSQKRAYPIQEVADIFTTYYVLKINEFDNVAKNTLDEWIYFLKNNEIKKTFKAKGLPEAKEKLRVDNLDKEEKDEYNRFIKNRRIQENEITTAKQDGYIKAEKKYKSILEEAKKREEEAKKREEKERKEKEKERKEKEEAKKREEEERKEKEVFMVKLAKKMIKFGDTIEEIMQETGLSKEVVEKLRSKKQ